MCCQYSYSRNISGDEWSLPSLERTQSLQSKICGDICDWQHIHQIISVNVPLTLSPGPRSWQEAVLIKNGLVIIPFYGTHKTCHLRTLVSLVWRSVSVFGIVSPYWPNGSGIESQWGARLFVPPTPPPRPLSLLQNGYRVLPRGKAAGAWLWPHTCKCWVANG